jgi:integrin beta 3
MIKRAEIRKHLRIQQQLKVGTLVLVAVLLLAAYPIYLFTRSVAQDPVFGDLDRLNLPAWATVLHEDAASGSRWCIGECRSRDRTWASERAPDETNAVYVSALQEAGWRPRTEGLCPAVDEGLATCWRRDEYVMNMWVRAPICNLPPPRPTIEGQAPVTPEATPDAAATPDPQATAMLCPGSLVTVRVFNAIDYEPDS